MYTRSVMAVTKCAQPGVLVRTPTRIELATTLRHRQTGIKIHKYVFQNRNSNKINATPIKPIEFKTATTLKLKLKHINTNT